MEKGIIKLIFEENQVTEKFKKRDFVIEQPAANYQGAKPNLLKFVLTQDRCDLIDRFKVGDEVEVEFNLKGTAWTKNDVTNYFVNLEAWKIEKISNDSFANKSSGSIVPEQLEDDDSGLPF